MTDSDETLVNNLASALANDLQLYQDSETEAGAVIVPPATKSTGNMDVQQPPVVPLESSSSLNPIQSLGHRLRQSFSVPATNSTTTNSTSNNASTKTKASFDSNRRQTFVAVIGGGVSGLAVAWQLSQSPNHTAHLYESDSKVGGHATTILIDGNNNNNENKTPVDIGFMVFNPENYPNMCAWFQELGVTTEDSNMSLSVSLDHGDTVEWSSAGLAGLAAKPSQLLDPKFYMFVRDMIRFNQQASALLRLAQEDPRRHVTTRQYLRDHGYGAGFAQYYLLPMMAALWSASLDDVLQFPAAQLIGFLCNHKMLQLFRRPQWKTVAGRSQQYTTKVQSILGDSVHVNSPVYSVAKLGNGKWQLKNQQGEELCRADEVVFACHPPLAKQMLERGNCKDKDVVELLGQIEYADNIVYIHSDPTLMPSRKQAWASWNCIGKSEYLDYLKNSSGSNKGEALEGAESGFGNTLDQSCADKSEEGRMKAVYVTYWLNRLQNLDCEKDIFVSLNPHERPDENLTHDRVIMAHPQFNSKTLMARDALEKRQGKDGLWFCGAWTGYGFHEDGCRSGFDVATRLSRVPLPWSTANYTVLPPPDLSKVSTRGLWSWLYQKLSYDLPVAVCKRIIFRFLNKAFQHGTFRLKLNDGTLQSFGDGSQCGCDDQPVTLRVFDDWFFVKAAIEYDLGLARSYMAGYFLVEPLENKQQYHPVIKPAHTSDETNIVIGDPVGLTRLFLLLIGNRDRRTSKHMPRKSGRGSSYANAFTNASGLLLAQFGLAFNYVRYCLTMDNSERGGSLKNIHAHYDLSNDLFTSFLDKETLMYSSAIYDTIPAPAPQTGLVFRGTLEQAQWRKLDTLLMRAQVQPGQTLLDIGFGWGGLSLHAAKRYGCKVTGITLSVEQKALAEKRVKKEGLEDLITFEVVDYRTFARRNENQGKFDRVLSCEMIEAVGHKHLGEFFWAVEQVLTRDGILVMEAITTPEQRYETYRRSTDFINSIIFPGSCCPSLHSLMDAAYKHSSLTLEHIDNIGLHYAETLAEWRRRFNANENLVRELGFDDVFLRAWNYYLTYCEAGFFSQTENCLILVFSRPGCNSLVPLCETRSVTQMKPLTSVEVQNWLSDKPSH
jgi:cyclopropane-fatty-acyl-phospholipid synthase